MRIDNSAASTFRFCPLKYWEKYVARYADAAEVGIEPQFGRENLDFGLRLHYLRHHYYKELQWKQPMRGPFYNEVVALEVDNVPLANPDLEDEAQATWQQYLAHYPQEDFEVVETEQTRVVPIPDSHHELVVKLDALIRRNGVLQVNDLKTEGRGSNNNDPENWAARPQVSLYVYAAKQLYPAEQVSDEVFLDVIKRRSPGGKKPPEFWRDAPRRSQEQIARDLRDLVWVADQIEACEQAGYWPRVGDNCKRGNFKCDYFNLHVNDCEAREALLERYYRPAEPYLQIEERIV